MRFTPRLAWPPIPGRAGRTGTADPDLAIRCSFFHSSSRSSRRPGLRTAVPSRRDRTGSARGSASATEPPGRPGSAAVAPAPPRPEGHASPVAESAGPVQQPPAGSRQRDLWRVADHRQPEPGSAPENLNGPRGAVRDHRRLGTRPGLPQSAVPRCRYGRAGGLARTHRHSGSPATMISGARATVSSNTAADCDSCHPA